MTRMIVMNVTIIIATIVVIFVIKFIPNITTTVTIIRTMMLGMAPMTEMK